ncbi:MAG: hypothetical protein AAFY46_00900 [Planctomycetota bacterium]
MRAFAALYSELDSTSSTSAKTAALVRYFEHAPAQDAAWAVALFLGKRPKGTASSKVVTRLAIESSGIPRWLFDECRSAVGEMAETVALLLPSTPASTESNRTLADVMASSVLPLATADESTRSAIVARAFESLPADQRYVYLKLIRGGFRVGVQRRMLARALATTAGVEPAVMEHRLAGQFSPTAEAYEQLIEGHRASDDTARPYPFYLASQLEVDPSELGDRAEWLAEWKWDGIRAQLIRRERVVP